MTNNVAVFYLCHNSGQNWIQISETEVLHVSKLCNQNQCHTAKMRKELTEQHKTVVYQQ